METRGVTNGTRRVHCTSGSRCHAIIILDVQSLLCASRLHALHEPVRLHPHRALSPSAFTKF
eukprot:2689565-Amphidinium_carterae.1